MVDPNKNDINAKDEDSYCKCCGTPIPKVRYKYEYIFRLDLILSYAVVLKIFHL